MKNTLILIFISSVLLLRSTVFAMPGRPIPKPDVKIEKALKVARMEHKKLIDKAGGRSSFKDMMVVLIEYKSQIDVIKDYEASKDKIKKTSGKEKWLWVIRFQNPVENDISITYVVTQGEKAFGVSQTW